jgi:hypothetical protein
VLDLQINKGKKKMIRITKINKLWLTILIIVASFNSLFCQITRERKSEMFKLAVMNKSTEPSYLVLIAINKKNKVKKEVATTGNLLFGAIKKEYSLKDDAKIMEIILSNQSMEFEFSNMDALSNIDFNLYDEFEFITYKGSINVDSIKTSINKNPAVNKKLRVSNSNWLFDYSNEAKIFADKKTQVMFAHVLFNNGIRTYKSEVGNIVLYHTIN